MATEAGGKRDVRREVTDRIIEAMENGKAPWQQPFQGGPRSGPVNAITGKPYTGGNHVWLAMVQPTPDPRWMTFNQAKTAGWSVKKGEHGVPIEVWKTYEKKDTVDLSQRTEKERAVLEKAGIADGQETTEQKRFAKIYTVFHASQVEGIPPLEVDPAKLHEFDLHAVGERLFDKTEHAAEILFDTPGAGFYSPRTDQIHLPPKNQFLDAGHLYATAAHEIAHSTMHPSRLNRDRYAEWEQGAAGDKTLRAREELRAEIASYLLSEKTGIPHHPENHESYVAGWVSLLRDSKNELYQAARDAEKIADYVIGQQKLLDISAPEKSVQKESIPPEKESWMETQVYHKVILTHRADLKERVIREPSVPDKPDIEMHYHPRQEISGVLKDFSKSEFILDTPEFGDVRVETNKRVFDGRDEELRDAVGKNVDVSIDETGKHLSLAVQQGQGVSILQDHFQTPIRPIGLLPMIQMGRADAQPVTGRLTHVHASNLIELKDTKGRSVLVVSGVPDTAHQAEIWKMSGRTVTVVPGEKLRLEDRSPAKAAGIER